MKSLHRRLALPLLPLLPLLFLLDIAAGCAIDVEDVEDDSDNPHESGKADSADDIDDDGVPRSPIASADDPTTVDVASWNIEWYGDSNRGPSDDRLQADNVASVIGGLDLDLFALVEVVSADAFTALVDRLPGYRGVLVSDPIVSGGAAAYSAREQKVALVVRDRFEVESARVILPELAWVFAGRPPMELQLRFSEDGKPRTLVVIVAHFKAQANEQSYERRRAASIALQDYLDAEYPYRWVLVVGDLNDDIDESTYAGVESPFVNFATHPYYRFTTDTLSEAAISSTTHFAATIDHHLATDDLAARFVEGSAEVLRIDRDIVDFDETTSDHYPVLTRYDLR